MRPIAKLLVATLLIAAPAWAAPAGWNAERAQGVAEKLAAAYDEIRDAVRGLQPPPPGSGRRAFHSAVDDVRLLKNAARHLSDRLKDGAGYDETLPIYKRIQSIRRDAADNAQRAGTIPQDVLAKIDKARDLALQLTAYYEHD